MFLALGINIEGQKELLGMWLAENEGAKFWLNVLTELKNRGLNDILIACVDGLKGFPDAINTVYPKARIQLCIVHMVRNSLRFVSWKDYKAVTLDLKAIYQAPTEEAGQQALEVFAAAWDSRYPQISRSWQELAESCHVLRLSNGHPQSDLYDECHRVAKQRDPPCDQKE